MPQLDLAAYPPALADLLRLLPLAPLSPGMPDFAVRERLQSLDDGAFGGRIIDRGMADACRAGLWLAFNFLDESHTISQEIETPAGTYWHGILHRREPDFGNAKYWFRRVGTHPIFAPLGADAVQLAGGAVNVPSPWDPFWFVDYCEACLHQDDQRATLARQLQRREWELLFDHCYRRASGAE